MTCVRSNFRALAVIAIGLSLLAGCSEEEVAKPLVRPVKSMVISEGHSGEVRIYPGKIRAAERVDLAFQVPGRLIRLNVYNGQKVVEGYVVAQLDGRDFESSLKAAKASFQRADAELRRARELVAKRLVSQSEFDQQLARRDIAETEVEKAQKAYDDTFLRAPFSGVVAKRYIDNHEDVTAKQPIISLQDNSQLEVVVNVPEVTVLRYEGKQDILHAVARFDGLPGKTFDLKLKEFATEADALTQTFEVVLALDLPNTFSVLPGMSVSVEALLPHLGAEQRFLLPASAVFSERTGKPGQFVWVIDEATMTVSAVPVEVGALRDSHIELLSGVEVGMRVVTAGVNYLNEGDKVRLLVGKIGA